MARQCSVNRRPGRFGRTISAQASRPHGLLGRALGHLWVKETASINDRAIALLDPAADTAVLEVGCGPGRAVAEMAARGARVTGVDPSEAMISQARRRNTHTISSGQVQLLVGEVTSIDLPNETFDAVLAVHTIYFWPDLGSALRELRRLLRPGGRICIGFRPAERELPRRLDPEVYRGPTSDQLATALHDAGFADVSFEDLSSAVVVVAHVPGPDGRVQRDDLRVERTSTPQVATRKTTANATRISQ